MRTTETNHDEKPYAMLAAAILVRNAAMGATR